jgi:hypothetical protein
VATHRNSLVFGVPPSSAVVPAALAWQRNEGMTPVVTGLSLAICVVTVTVRFIRYLLVFSSVGLSDFLRFLEKSNLPSYCLMPTRADAFGGNSGGNFFYRH